MKRFFPRDKRFGVSTLCIPLSGENPLMSERLQSVAGDIVVMKNGEPAE